MDNRNTAFENYWASQWVDFDDTDTTERRKRIARDAFDAGWSASLTDEVQDSIHAAAKAEALKEAAEKIKLKAYRTIVNCRPAYVVNYNDVTAILADKQEPQWEDHDKYVYDDAKPTDKQKDAKLESQIRQQIVADVKAELESLCEEWIFTTLKLIILYSGKNLFSTDKQEGS